MTTDRPTVIADRYELGSLLGAGGSSRVFRAHDRRLGRDVAIKLLDLYSGDPAARERFLREALVGSRISHPNAVTVFDTGDDNGVLYITMELVAGEDLARRLARTGPLPERDATAIAASVLDVLDAAHASGVIHRDVKPANIILQDGGPARLVDFGIARPLGELTAGLTATGQVIGTAKYLSPEQAAGQPLTTATDLYSVGVVLYEMLTGRPPFIADNAIAVALAHRDQPPPPVQNAAPNVDPSLAAVVHYSLAKDPAARYPSAAAMRDALATGEAPAIGLTVPMAAGAGVGVGVGVGVGQGADPTESLPATSTDVHPASAPDVPDDLRRRHLAWTALATGVAAAVLVAVLVFLSTRDGTDPDDVTAGETTTTTTTSTSTTTTAPAQPAPTPPPTTTAELTIGELTDLVAEDPRSYGEKGEDLLDKLQKVQRENDEKRGEEASKAIEEIDKWVEEGELDPTIAEQARTVLRQYADD